MTIVGGGAAFAVIERPEQTLSSWDGIWWALTVTTVGYGDHTPETSGGRIIALVVMTVGIGFVALITAAAAERFAAAGLNGGREEGTGDPLIDRLDEIAGRLERIEREIGKHDAG